MWSIRLTDITICCRSGGSLTEDNYRITIQYNFTTRRSSIAEKGFEKMFFLPSTNWVDSVTCSCRIATARFHWERVCGGSFECVCVCVCGHLLYVCVLVFECILWLCRQACFCVKEAYYVCRKLDRATQVAGVFFTFTADILWEMIAYFTDYWLPIYYQSSLLLVISVGSISIVHLFLRFIAWAAFLEVEIDLQLSFICILIFQTPGQNKTDTYFQLCSARWTQLEPRLQQTHSVPCFSRNIARGAPRRRTPWIN